MMRIHIEAGRAAHVAIFLAACTTAIAQTREIKAAYKIANQSIGTYRESEVTTNSGGIETTIDSDLVFNRLGIKLEMKSTTAYQENNQGSFLGLTSNTSSSKQTTQMTVKATPNALAIAMTVGGKTYNRSLAYSGTLIGPEAGRKLILSKLHLVGDTLSYQSFSPELGVVTSITDKLTEIGSVGKAVKALKLEQKMSGMPGTATIWLDSEGWLVSQTTPSPLGDLVATRISEGDKNVAVTIADLPSEMFTSTVIKSNVRLPKERLIDEITLKLIHKHPELGWPDFVAPNQKVLQKSKTDLILRINRPKPSAGSARPVLVTAETQQFLKPNALLQSDDPTVKAISANVVKRTDDSWAAIRKLQRWTNDNMHFDLGVAAIPASEVAKNKGGTCFGYSILLGSLARAVGIPSRVRMGFVYAGGIWGGHAWDEVLIGDKWIPIDSALYTPGSADAARFSCFTGSLEEGTLGGQSGLAQLFGNVDVKIMDYTVEGKRTVVSDDAKPYAIHGNTYRNPWLQFSITKPNNYKFTNYKVTWPLATLVAMEGPNKQLIEVRDESATLPTGSKHSSELFKNLGFKGPIARQRIGNHNVLLMNSSRAAAILIENAGSLWIIKSTGEDATRRLLQVAATIKL